MVRIEVETIDGDVISLFEFTDKNIKTLKVDVSEDENWIRNKGKIRVTSKLDLYLTKNDELVATISR